MKRAGGLWPRILAFENLLEAARKAQLGKRYKPSVLRFNARLEQELLRIQDELRDHSYFPGAYYTFEILEPKRRLISAAPYRDRVVHHALCNVPVLERGFIPDSYANRKGFGSHRPEPSPWFRERMGGLHPGYGIAKATRFALHFCTPAP